MRDLVDQCAIPLLSETHVRRQFTHATLCASHAMQPLPRDAAEGPFDQTFSKSLSLLRAESLAYVPDSRVFRIESDLCTIPSMPPRREHSPDGGGSNPRARAVRRILEVAASAVLWRTVPIKRELRARRQDTLAVPRATREFRLRPDDLRRAGVVRFVEASGTSGTSGRSYVHREDCRDVALARHGSAQALAVRDAHLSAKAARRRETLATRELRRAALEVEARRAADLDPREWARGRFGWRFIVSGDVELAMAADRYQRSGSEDHRAAALETFLRVRDAVLERYRWALHVLETGTEPEGARRPLPRWPTDRRGELVPPAAERAADEYAMFDGAADRATLERLAGRWASVCDVWAPSEVPLDVWAIRRDVVRLLHHDGDDPGVRAARLAAVAASHAWWTACLRAASRHNQLVAKQRTDHVAYISPDLFTNTIVTMGYGDSDEDSDEPPEADPEKFVRTALAVNREGIFLSVRLALRAADDPVQQTPTRQTPTKLEVAFVCKQVFDEACTTDAATATRRETIERALRKLSVQS
jgi:hypothetical protein